MLGLGLDLVCILGLGLTFGKFGKFGQLNKVKRVKEYYSLIQNISLMANVLVHKCSLHTTYSIHFTRGCSVVGHELK